MARLIVALVAGLILGFVIAAFADRLLHRAPQPTSQIVNRPTKAREIRVLKRGFDNDQRRFKPQVEKH